MLSLLKNLKTDTMTTFRESEAKEEIRKVFNDVSFRKFGNAFRKHIDPYFTADLAGYGRVSSTFLWSELASYIIGDGDYTVSEEEYKNFISEFK